MRRLTTFTIMIVSISLVWWTHSKSVLGWSTHVVSPQTSRHYCGAGFVTRELSAMMTAQQQQQRRRRQILQQGKRRRGQQRNQRGFDPINPTHHGLATRLSLHRPPETHRPYLGRYGNFRYSRTFQYLLNNMCDQPYHHPRWIMSESIRALPLQDSDAVEDPADDEDKVVTVPTQLPPPPPAAAAAAKEEEQQLVASPASQRQKLKLRRHSGLAKAVDRGQYPTVYRPFPIRARSGLPDRTRPFVVLGIESSCDDTGAAVVRSDGVILGEALASQGSLHEEWGGVVPNLAKEAHMEAIDRVVQQALDRAGMDSVACVDAVGVTIGPGLEICLRVGANKAKQLAVQYNKPFVGVHHLEAHVLMARLPLADGPSGASTHPIPATDETHATERAVDFPFLALLVSGGHCQLLQCSGIGQYNILGGTLDDSLGEAFDKTARLLGLPVGGGGGPAVERLAREGDPCSIPLTIPMTARKDCDFSYAGLKTNIRRAAQSLAEERGVAQITDLPQMDKANLAASFQHVAIVHIEQRLRRAMELLEQQPNFVRRSLVVVGGVAANFELRNRLDKLCDDRQWRMYVPPPRLCTDQGTMSAWAAIERLMIGSSDDPQDCEVCARFPFSSNAEVEH